MSSKNDIKNLTADEIQEELRALGESDFRTKQILSWLYQRQKSLFAEFTDLPASLRQKLETKFIIGRLEAVEKLQSEDGTTKFLFKLHDGFLVETVIIPSGKRRTVCLSTQAGCKFSCVFCASGLNGFKRNLTPSEITGQVSFLMETLGGELTNFVFMGMGEPFDNCENVFRAIRMMNSPDAMGIAARRMTISTCGIVPGIERLGALGLQVNLSLSLHAVTDGLRDELMPVNRKYPLETIIKACEEYIESGGRMMTLEYIPLWGINDSRADAEGLAGIARRLRAKVNVIEYNPVPGLAFQAPEESALRLFIQWLEERKVQVTKRRSKGKDIAAACGQLAGRARSLPGR